MKHFNEGIFDYFKFLTELLIETLHKHYREAARECRRKKKEYIKCLENRVAVLETQNKTLIDELKSLKELYCQTGDNVQNH